MSQIAAFAGNAGRQRIRITKPTLGLIILRFMSAVGVVQNGLAAGLPEVASFEITHPSRHRADGGADVPLGMAALYGQYLKGPIAETRQEGGKFQTEVNYWLNQSSAIDLTSEDQAYFTFTPDGNANTRYEIYAPELPVVAPHGSSFLNYEVQRMSSDLRSKLLPTYGCSCIIIPNDATKIDHVTVTAMLADGGTKELDYSLRELLSAAQRANPQIAVLDNLPGTNTGTGLDVLLSQDAQYILITTNAVSAVELYNKLGATYDYLVVKVLDRNALG